MTFSPEIGTANRSQRDAPKRVDASIYTGGTKTVQ